MQAKLSLLILLVLLATVVIAQQSAEQPIVNAGQAKFATLPGAPECATYAPQRGDPKTGDSVTVAKFEAGCTAPMHWHSASEQLMIISGSAQLQMKGDQVQSLNPGAYAYTPAHHAHQLSCPNGCTFYRTLDGPADIHYIDNAGNEIPAQTALAAFGEHPAPAAAPK